MSNTTESPFSLTRKVGKNNDLLTGRADTADEMIVRIQELDRIEGHIDGGDALADIKESLGATEVKPSKPAPPAPVPQAPTGSGDMRVVSTKYPDKFYIYDHPKAILTPKGTKAILLWARSSNGKPYTKWVDEDVAELGKSQREGWGEMTEWGFDTSDLPVLANS